MRTIATDRLILRPWQPDDVEFLLDLEGRWEVVRYLGSNPTPLTSHDQARASIERRRTISQHSNHGIWLIADRDGARMGDVLLKPIPVSVAEMPSDPPEVEMGWHLHPDAWGNGCASEAAAAVAAEAFARGQDRIISVTHPENSASQAVCRRIGMRPLGPTTKYMDTSCDLFELARLKRRDSPPSGS